MTSNNSDTVKGIIDLYTKIPDYSDIKHLGNSEFINKIEKLKEEFRIIRSSLYEDNDDVDWLSESTKNALHVTTRSVGIQRKNLNVTPSSSKNNDKDKIFPYKKPTYLSIRGCEIHRTPSATEFKPITKYYRPITAASFSKSTSNLFSGTQNKNQCGEPDYDDDDGSENSLSNFGSTASGSGTISRWSSSPDISTLRRKEYIPPKNIEQRLQIRKSQNNDQGQLLQKLNPETPKILRPHPIPNHVFKPLFNEIMLQSKKRSKKVREQSKQKLLAQVKPFTFSKLSGRSHGFKTGDGGTQPLNNARTIKTKSTPLKGTAKINNNTSEDQIFRAHPAPPRSRAIMAALRLKEQQEYRELKKQLRAEALMKMSSLPPGMAARNKLNQNQLKGSWSSFDCKQRKGRDSLWDAYSSCTDDDRVSENSFVSNKSEPSPSNGKKKTKKLKSSKGNHESKYLSQALKRSGAIGVFESTSNDNNASRLRVQAARNKEAERLKRNEEEHRKLLRNEDKRYKLRHMHSDVWRHACSYSSNQDIAMRRQLRIAASILERDCFRKDMSTMLSRVRSAPLLLEGVRERRSEPCKKHLQEMQATFNSTKARCTPSSAFGPEKYCSRINWTSCGDDNLAGAGTSETAAVAEGSITNSDNESLKDIPTESEEDDSAEAKPIDEELKQIKDKSHSHDVEALDIERAADAIIGFDEAIKVFEAERDNPN